MSDLTHRPPHSIKLLMLPKSSYGPPSGRALDFIIIPTFRELNTEDIDRGIVTNSYYLGLVKPGQRLPADGAFLMLSHFFITI
jgi:hypothetical protein